MNYEIKDITTYTDKGRLIYWRNHYQSELRDARNDINYYRRHAEHPLASDRIKADYESCLKAKAIIENSLRLITNRLAELG